MLRNALLALVVMGVVSVAIGQKKDTPEKLTKELEAEIRSELKAYLDEADARKRILTRQIGLLNETEYSICAASLKEVQSAGSAQNVPPEMVRKARKLAPTFVDKVIREDALKSGQDEQLTRSRFMARDREKKYHEFAGLLGIQAKWSLSVPFDDLNKDDMGKALDIALVCGKLGGITKLNKQQRLLLLRAGGSGWVASQLGP